LTPSVVKGRARLIIRIFRMNGELSGFMFLVFHFSVSQFFNIIENKITVHITCICTLYSRSQRPRLLTHKLSSPARTLGSWVRIPLEAWMSVCVYSVFVLLCV
jgi:hypothetical protein